MSMPLAVKDIKKNKTYTFLEEWGRGAYGICFSVLEEESKSYYACKISQNDSFELEIEIHSQLKHEQVVQFISSFQSIENHQIHMILEPCENGTIDLLLECRKSLTHPEARCIATQVARGLDYLHARLIIHRDIKPLNLLLSSTMTVKIADFGLSHVLSNPKEKLLSILGTETYLAPEMRNRSGYGVEVDIWALGCVIYSLLEGESPFLKKPFNPNVKIANSSKIGPLACKFLNTIFVENPSARPTAKTMLKHKYFTTKFTPERLESSVFFKKSCNPIKKREPLRDMTNQKLTSSFIPKITGKENVTKKATCESHASQFTMSLRARKTFNDLPFLGNVWLDKGAKLAKRLLNELLDIRVLSSDWDLAKQFSPFTCVSCWVLGIAAFGYQINNGAVGIDFAQGDFYHRSPEGEETLQGPHGYTNYPSKKNLLKTLRTLNDLLVCLNSGGPRTKSKAPVFVVVKKCYLPEKETYPFLKPTIGFLLSNGSCQVFNLLKKGFHLSFFILQMNFNNHEKLIVNLHEDLVVSWNSEKVAMSRFRDLRRRGIPLSLSKKIQHMCHFLAVSQHQTV